MTTLPTRRFDPVAVAPSAGRAPDDRMPTRRARSRPAKPIRLTKRDVEVLEALAVHRVLSAEQLRRLIFGCSASRVRRRLGALSAHKYVEQVELVAQPSRGVPRFVYVLGVDGARMLAELGAGPKRRGLDGVELPFIRHRLLVNDFYITLVEATRGARCAVTMWKHEEGLRLPGEGVSRAVERVPAFHPSWRQRRTLPFLPDAFFAMDVGAESPLLFFFELDLATHSLRKWQERAVLYTTYADPRQGRFRARFGGGRRDNFRVLIVTTPDYRKRSRCGNVLGAIEKMGSPTDLFLAATLADMRPERILGRVWRRPGSPARSSLLDNPTGRPRVRVRPPA